jgi:hypothetical protein
LKKSRPTLFRYLFLKLHSQKLFQESQVRDKHAAVRSPQTAAKRVNGFLASLALALSPLACSLDTAPENGKQRCADPPSAPCTDGFHCGDDGRCWRVGTGPGQVAAPTDAIAPASEADASLPPNAMAPASEADASLPPDAFVPHVPLPAPSGRTITAGGSWMESPVFRAVVTAGQTPGGNRVMKSANYRFVGGLVGSTGSAEDRSK